MSERKIVSTLFYQSKKTSFMWDTWIFYHKGIYHLYYVSNASKSERWWDSVSLAVSGDGVHWNEYGKVIDAAPDAKWLGAGAVLASNKSPTQRKKFIMNFSEWIGSDEEGYQTIFFSESDDLFHWERLDSNFEFRQDTQWYEADGRWDNIWPVRRPDGSFFGYWAARPKDEKVGLGFGESSDGVSWHTLAPPTLKDVLLSDIKSLSSPELGGAYFFQDKYYVVVGLNDLDTVWNKEAEFRPGMTTFVSDSPAGPFHPAKKNRRLIVGNASYFCRFVDTPEGVLVNHHSWEINPERHGGVSKEGAFLAPLKKAVWDKEGILRLYWWDQNNKAKKAPETITKSISSGPITLIDNSFSIDDVLIVEGLITVPQQTSSQLVGLYIEGSDTEGTAFVVRSNGLVEYGTIQSDATGFKKAGWVDRELEIEGITTFRIVRKSRMTEFYLNDVLMQCYCLPENGTGRLGIIGSVDQFEDIMAWTIE